jgi:branched-chain amino acid aminotransferase
MQSSCDRTLMQALPMERISRSCQMKLSGTTSPTYHLMVLAGRFTFDPCCLDQVLRIGVQPADEYTFICLCVIPVGDCYKGGLSKPVDALIISKITIVRLRGVGNVKLAGNYAARLACPTC